MGDCCSKTDTPSLLSRSTTVDLPREKSTIKDNPDLYITTKDISDQRKAIATGSVDSLDNALKDLFVKHPHLREQLAKARQRCCKSTVDKLTREGSAALYFYSMEKGEKSFFAYHQAAQRSGDSNQLIPFEKFLKLYFNAYKKLPKLKKDVWMVIPLDDEWAKILKDENKHLQTRMGPVQIALFGEKEFVKKKYDKPTITVRIRNAFPANMADYISNGVRETVLPPGLKLIKFKETQILTDGSLIFHLKVVWGTEENLPNVHFVCPIVACDRHCKHPLDLDGHANGYIFFVHDCKLHSKPVIECSFCLEAFPDIRICRGCQNMFCKTCSMKDISELKF